MQFPSGRAYGCGVEVALDLLAGKWKPVLLANLKDGPRRYGELRALVPRLSDKMLTQRLRDLEEVGLVERVGARSRGAPAVYRLTARGESLRPVLTALHTWGEELARETGARIVRPAAREGRKATHRVVR